METRVHTDNHITGSEHFAEKYSEELNIKLHRFAEYLSGADIYFVDENKAKASINDKKCTIEIKIKTNLRKRFLIMPIPSASLLMGQLTK
ncbi:MAG: hypothetical protein IPH58_07185 [Sphingobacteriales bacterium]|nr:hypothetical protein [Sphingobacteriales bacterium]